MTEAALPPHLDPAFEAIHHDYVNEILAELLADADAPDTRGSSAPDAGE
ncbi:hypothetical protein [Methylobacterium sp. Leaf94]|nr:hypothetical protein [Methylobacterium sp. Leaf94]